MNGESVGSSRPKPQGQGQKPATKNDSDNLDEIRATHLPNSVDAQAVYMATCKSTTLA